MFGLFSFDVMLENHLRYNIFPLNTFQEFFDEAKQAITLCAYEDEDTIVIFKDTDGKGLPARQIVEELKLGDFVAQLIAEDAEDETDYLECEKED